jgi:hypothetical protein
MWDQIDDLDFCLAKLFLKITIFMVFFFTTNRNNQAGSFV